MKLALQLGLLFDIHYLDLFVFLMQVLVAIKQALDSDIIDVITLVWVLRFAIVVCINWNLARQEWFLSGFQV